MKTCFNDLSGKSIFVTGASRGIGRAIALSLAEQKATVIFNYRKDEESAKELANEIEKLGGKAHALKFDVTETEKMKTEVDNFFKSHGVIHGLVNNAGISKDQLLLRLKEEDIDNVLAVNLKSVMLLTSFLTRYLMKTEWSSIVNVSSIVGLMGNPSQAVYAASKAGLIGFTKSVAKELSSRKVRCNAICPGFISTDMTDALDTKVKEAYLETIPLKSFGSVEDVSNLVSFLLSESSRYITGQAIKIDGGLYI